MSTLEHKLFDVNASRPSSGRAQAARSMLLKRWGAVQVNAQLIHINTMGGQEIWRCGSPSPKPAAGDVFEQEVRS